MQINDKYCDDRSQLILNWHLLKIQINNKICNNIYFSNRDIWWASIGINVGHEEDGKNSQYERPILILKKFNRHIILVIPLSSKIKESKNYYYKFVFNEIYRSALICQIRLISSKRLIRKIGYIDIDNFDKIKAKVTEFFK